MEYRVVTLPPFEAACSGVSRDFDFSPEGVLGRFSEWFSGIVPQPRDAFVPRDFLYYDAARGGMEWLYALCEGMDDGGFSRVQQPGGLYLTYAYRDGDEAAGAAAQAGAEQWLRDTGVLEPDPERPAMGHILTPQAVQKALGWAQMETYLPIRLK